MSIGIFRSIQAVTVVGGTEPTTFGLTSLSGRLSKRPPSAKAMSRFHSQMNTASS